VTAGQPSSARAEQPAWPGASAHGQVAPLVIAEGPTGRTPWQHAKTARRDSMRRPHAVTAYYRAAPDADSSPRRRNHPAPGTECRSSPHTRLHKSRIRAHRSAVGTAALRILSPNSVRRPVVHSCGDASPARLARGLGPSPWRQVGRCAAGVTPRPPGPQVGHSPAGQQTRAQSPQARNFRPRPLMSYLFSARPAWAFPVIAFRP
jgi:hypothetical protein